MAASTLLRLLKQRLLSLSEHLGGIMQIFPHCDIDMWGCVWMSRFRGGWRLRFWDFSLCNFRDLISAQTACNTPKRKQNLKSHHMTHLNSPFNTCYVNNKWHQITTNMQNYKPIISNFRGFWQKKFGNTCFEKRWLTTFLPVTVKYVCYVRCEFLGHVLVSILFLLYRLSFLPQSLQKKASLLSLNISLIFCWVFCWCCELHLTQKKEVCRIKVNSRAVTVWDFFLPRWISNKYRGLAVNRMNTPPKKKSLMTGL